MKSKYFSIYLFLLFLSCNSLDNRKTKNPEIYSCCKYASCPMYTNKYTHTNDSLEVENIIRQRASRQEINKEHVAKLVFAKSNIEIVEVKGEFQDYKLDKFKSCQAKMNNDTVEISILYNHLYSGESRFAGKSLRIRCWENKFKSEILHFSDVLSGNGLPNSSIYFEQLDLNKSSFEKGDTICGRINIRAKYGSKITQMVKGNFKSIII